MKTTDLKTKGSLNPLSISIFLIFSVIFVMLFALGVINIFVFIISMAFSVLLSNSIHIADQWERAVVLRMGKYSGLKGPGLFMIIPIIDRVSTYIDQRVRVSAFKAEQTLTKDTVPVNVDTVVYWTVWDVEKAALEVQEYQTAIEQIAQTGLRDTIGKHELSTLLQERDKIAEDLQQVLDKNTNPWGITCQTVGIKDIAIPKDLAEAMSKEAQAERERRARVILGVSKSSIKSVMESTGPNMINNIFPYIKKNFCAKSISYKLVTPVSKYDVNDFIYHNSIKKFNEKIKEAYCAHYFFGSWDKKISLY